MNRSGVSHQPSAQLQGKGFDPIAPGHLPIGEPVVVDLPEESLDQGPQYGGLVREVGVDGVRRDAELGGDPPDRHRGRSAGVQLREGGVEDGVLRDGAR